MPVNLSTPINSQINVVSSSPLGQYGTVLSQSNPFFAGMNAQGQYAPTHESLAYGVLLTLLRELDGKGIAVSSKAVNDWWIEEKRRHELMARQAKEAYDKKRREAEETIKHLQKEFNL